ncbi:exopolysaccharide biosynthesis polyprenyl glycosylphosphotransferase [Nakamurella multipartita DSM 44233]|uniref:Exopolysaccharide biosynthesis polyprenyl glycosylphosphotransferase n=1 Tax=Nakamurella multipartita (strain ATCC 700099 / DSM 44233 / CIP 104796 / JCM 9543 / NBRC 105858 / Y-104) TaxID=479431 RepID=C8XCS3_NAKMY|nr:exopolysaccharide biosynthesis polyprenyl glycosylphosphotransferase [Nakamurella multipartita DSM 44233]
MPTEALAPYADQVARRRLNIPVALLGQGIWPLVLAADLFALIGAKAMLGQLTVRSLVTFTICVVIFALAGLYRSRLTLSALDDLPRVALGMLGTVGLSTIALSLLDRPSDQQHQESQLLFAVLTVAIVTILRSLAYLAIRSLRRHGIAHRTVVVGAGLVGQSVARTLHEHPEYGLAPVGFVDSDPLSQLGDYEFPILGHTDTLPKVLQLTGVRTVIIAFSTAPEEQMIDVIRQCDRLNCEIFILPRLFEVHHVSTDMDYIWGVPLTRLRRGAYRASSWPIKRMMDIAASGLALALLSPVMALIALAVRIEGGPGVLFKQIRVGVDGRHFELLKFRSLRPVDETESATNWNISHDDRLGPVGRILRTSSLDELPQLLNILRGDMSIVGPRPERPHFVDQFRQTYPRYWARHRVPCGLTGWAQIHGLRGDTSIADRARFDNYYVENWSLWLDVKIIIRTAGAVFTRAGS